MRVVPVRDLFPEHGSEEQAHAEIRSECKFGISRFLFDDKPEDHSKKNADECCRDDGLPAEIQARTSHQNGIAELNAAHLFAGFFLDESTADLTDPQKRNADAGSSDEPVPDPDIRDKIRGDRKSCDHEGDYIIHFHCVPVDKPDADEHGCKQAHQQRVPVKAEYQKTGDIQKPVQGFDNRIPRGDLFSAVVALAPQKQPAEHRNQINDPDFGTADRLMRDSPRGTRMMTTFRKLPMQIP